MTALFHLSFQRAPCEAFLHSRAWLNEGRMDLQDAILDVATADTSAYVEQCANKSMLFSLQALLVRHEAYMADAERERLRTTSTIEQLGQDKKDLEASNAQMVQENRELLDQLEELNHAVTNSDAHIKSLEATLQSTQQELQRLTVLASRTEALEKQLAQFEREQAEVEEKLATSQGDEKTAVQRWQKAERTIAGLQDQIDRIEREAKEEKERHVEVLGRMERRAAVERELQTAAGRLKGAAAAKAGGREATGSNVVSHFVKDILQDNANLQLGLVELREMLLNSNDEVERLRDQLMVHQPIDDGTIKGTAPTLQRELSSEAARNQELHVHHHYHAPTADEPARIKTPVQRRVKKKRNVITPNHFTPPARGHSSRFGPSTPSSAAAILSQTSVSIPPQRTTSRAKRWSVQSAQSASSVAASSVPDSPYNHSRHTSSVYDRVFSDAGTESSRPTSPESDAPDSPYISFTNKPVMDSTWRSVSTPAAFQLKRSSIASSLGNVPDMEGDLEELQLPPSDNGPIPEEAEESLSPLSSDTAPMLDYDTTSTSEISEVFSPRIEARPALRRAASHESLLSISGMDIHTLQSRPSQLLTGNSFAPAASLASTNLSPTTATAARPSASAATSLNRSLLNGMAADARGPRSRASDRTLGQKVGGWVFGKWGSTPAPATTYAAAPAGSTGSAARQSKPGSPSARQPSPGVTKAGAVRGLPMPPSKSGAKPIVGSLDHNALRESLEEG